MAFSTACVLVRPMPKPAPRKTRLNTESSGAILPPGTREGRLTAHANPALQNRSLRSLEKVLAAAEVVLGREGWSAFTINAVAAEAGVSVGGIYRRFASKEHLLRAIKDRVLDRADHDHKE